MPSTPQNKAATRTKIQANNPLDAVGNLNAVPDEFRMPAGGAPTPEEMAQFREWQASLLAQTAAQSVLDTETGAQVEALPLAASEQRTSISESGRAPKVAASGRVWIVLDDNDEIPPGGQFIGINGVGYKLMAGIEAFVPKAICEVLDQAVKSIPVQDPITHQVIGWKSRKRFPYTIINKRAEMAEA